MKTSTEIAKLAGALSKAQGKFKAASKDSVNPHFRNRYADLASIWDAIREPLSANGLAVVQGAETSSKEALVTTTLIHESGEWAQTTIAIPIGKSDAQGVGGAITYGRRYGLTALVGIVQDDDDGETAVGRGGVLRSTPVITKAGSGGKLPNPDVVTRPPGASGGPGSAPNGVPGLQDVLNAINGSGSIEALKGVWEDAQQFAGHPDFAQVVKAKDDAKVRLSTQVPDKVTKVVSRRKPTPAEETIDKIAEQVPVEPADEDDIPFE